MASNKKPQPLVSNQPITREGGFPTDYFTRWAQERQIAIENGVTPDQVTALIESWAAARDINAGTGLAGGGNLSADRTLRLADTAVAPAIYGDATHVGQFTVDQQGRIILAANVPITGGGGGGGYTPMPQVSFLTNASAGSGTNNFVMTIRYAAQACTLKSLTVPCASPPTGVPQLFAGVYSNNSPTSFIPKNLLGQSPGITGVVAGQFVTFTFAAPIAIAADTLFWIGVGAFGGGGSMSQWYTPYNLIRQYFGIASAVLPAVAPATSADTHNGFSWWLNT